MGNGRDTRRGGAPGPEATRSAGSSGRQPDLSRREAAEYIAGLLNGLRPVAEAAGMKFLAYLLGMALEEAQAEKAREDQPS